MKSGVGIGLGVLVAALALLCFGPESGFAATLTVNSTADPGDGVCDATECTLREAIIAANIASDRDTISFNISPGGVKAIAPAGSLPTITTPVSIDGTTQPGYTGTPIIELNGTAANTGLEFTSGGNIVRGLVVNRFIFRGIDFQSNLNSLSNSYIGTDVAGASDLGNASGIRILDGNNNCIGGTISNAVCTRASGDRNVISGNTQAGALITGTSTGNILLGNYIGTDASGSFALGNGGDGVNILSSPGNTIGGVNGTTPGGACTGDCNLVSGNLTGIRLSGNNNTILGNFIGTDINGNADLGNSFFGIRTSPDNLVSGTVIGNGTAAGRNLIAGNAFSGVDMPRSSSNVVQGNYIGTNSAGIADLGNDQNGISVGGIGSANTIGGSGPGEANLVSGNNTNGILVGGGSNTVRGNLIGVMADGSSPLGNSLAGVFVNGSNASNNTIGGTDLGQANVIAFNSGDGVRIATGTGNSIRGNSIYSNGLTSIENLTGGNGEPGHVSPVITAVGSASGTACANCVIDVYSDAADESGVWQGSVAADAAGNWTYFGPVSGPNVTAAATNGSGSTSELSAAFACGDFDADAVSNCADSEDDGDGFSDEVEGGIALCKNAVNDDSFETETIYFVNDGCPAIGIPEVNCGGALDNDLDGFVNDGCPKDGLFSEADFKIGTGQQDPCGNNGWPLELVSTPASTANRYNISDLGSFVAPVRRLGKNPDQAGFSSRWDLVPGPITGAPGLGWINVQDLATTTSGATAFPPMLGGVKVSNQTCPFPP